MATLADVIQAYTEQNAELDGLLTTLDDDAWLKETPAAGWDTRDTVSHLADTNDIAYDCVTDGPRTLIFEAQQVGGTVDDFTAHQVAKGRAMSSADVYAWWTSSCARLVDGVRAWDENERIHWGPNWISPRSFVTARLMETWAHSLDCFAAAGKETADTDRLEHVAYLGWRALPYAFSIAGETPPGPIRLELDAPSGARWTIGPDDAPTVIAGAASDWCRVVVQRDRGDERQRLEAKGPDAEGALKHAQAYLA